MGLYTVKVKGVASIKGKPFKGGQDYDQKDFKCNKKEFDELLKSGVIAEKAVPKKVASDLESLKDELAKANDALKAKDAELAEAKKTLKIKVTGFDEVTKSLTDATEALKAKETELAKANDALKAAQDELKKTKN